MPSGIKLVLVTPEAAIGDAFGSYLNYLRGLQQLDRITIDECHVVLNDPSQFRPQLQRLGELVRSKSQRFF